MKILIISKDFKNIKGGISDYVFYLGKSLVEIGNTVVVITSKKEEIISDPRIKIIPLIENWGFKSFFQIRKIIHSEKPNCINLQFQPYMYSYYGIPFYIPVIIGLIRVLGFPVVTTFHEVATNMNIKKPKYWAIGIFQRLIAIIIIGISNKTIFNNVFYKRMLFGFNPKKFLVYNGSNIPKIGLSPREKYEIRKFAAPRGEKIISMFGGPDSWSESKPLLKAILKLSKETNIRVKLFVLGGLGDVGYEIHKKVNPMLMLINKYKMKKQVFVSGYQHESQIFKYLSVSDLFVLFNVTGFGGICIKSTSLAAAFSAGVPVMGNKGVLTDEIFQPDKNILFVKKVEELEIFNSFRRFFLDEKLQAQLKNGSEETYEKNLKWETIAKKYNTIFLEYE